MPPKSTSNTPEPEAAIIWPSTEEALATLKDAKLLDDKTDITPHKLATLIYNTSCSITCLNTQNANKLRKDLHAMAKLVSRITSHDNIKKKLGSAVNAILSVSDKLDNLTEETKATLAVVKDIQATNAKMTTTIEAIPAGAEESANRYCNALLADRPPLPPIPTTQETSAPPPTMEAAKMAAQQEVHAWQLLIDYPRTTDPTTLPSLTAAKELIEKAITATNPEDENTCAVKAVQHLKNGGIIVELATPTGVNWLQNVPGNKTIFEDAFGHGVSIKQQTFLIILTGVPTTADMDSSTFLRELEEANNLPTGTIVKGSWVKPIERRRETQTIAFA
jgi:hypothetical protein